MKKGALAALAAACLACSNAAPPAAPAAEPLHRKPVDAVASVAVSLDRELLPPDRQERFDVNGASEVLRASLESALRERDKLRTDSPFQLELVVHRYRLRSTTTVVLLPGLSGQDNLGGTAIVREGDLVVRTIPVFVELLRPFEWPSSASRIQRLAEGLSARVANGL